MKKKLILILSMGTLITCTAIAQQVQDPSAKKEAMSNLKMLEGAWKGGGWASSPDGSKNEFDQSELIKLKLGGLALLIEGEGYSKTSGDLIHDALGVITFNDIDKEYLVQTHLATGQSANAKGYFEGEKFFWGFEVPAGQVRYAITATDSTWNEYGEFSRDGSQWFKFMEMNLEKVKDN